MGYLDNSTVTVDAILTKKGRELLATNNTLGITQFALSDDEIDYTLWNPKHPLGSNYYGIVIENMPLVEAVPDESQHMRSKLITITPAKAGDLVVGIPFVEVNKSIPTTTVITKAPTNAYTIIPSTIYFPYGSGTPETTTLNNKLGYTAILSSADLGTLTAITKVDNNILTVDEQNLAADFLGDATGIDTINTKETQTVTKVGLRFTFMPKIPSNKPTTPLKGTITIIGNETGNYDIIPFSISKL